jgi:MFS family permease
MLDLRLFRRLAFSGVMLGGLLLSVAAFATMPYVSLWTQVVLGMGPVRAGLVLLPMSGAAFLAAFISGRFLHGMSARWPIGIGLLLIGAGDLWQGTLHAGSTAAAAVMPGLALAGFGVGAVTPVLSSAALAAVPPERAGMAGGAVNTFRQLGLALGIAIFDSLFQHRLEATLRSREVANPRRTASALGGGQVDAVLAHAPTAARETLDHTIRLAFTNALNEIYLTAALTGLAAALLCLTLIRPTHTASPASPASPARAGRAGRADQSARGAGPKWSA